MNIFAHWPQKIAKWTKLTELKSQLYKGLNCILFTFFLEGWAGRFTSQPLNNQPPDDSEMAELRHSISSLHWLWSEGSSWRPYVWRSGFSADSDCNLMKPQWQQSTEQRNRTVVKLALRMSQAGHQRVSGSSERQDGGFVTSSENSKASSGCTVEWCEAPNSECRSCYFILTINTELFHAAN